MPRLWLTRIMAVIIIVVLHSPTLYGWGSVQSRQLGGRPGGLGEL